MKRGDIVAAALATDPCCGVESKGPDTICDLPSRLKVGDEPRTTSHAAPFARVFVVEFTVVVLLLPCFPMDRLQS